MFPIEKKYEEEVVYKTHLLVLPHFLPTRERKKVEKGRGKSLERNHLGENECKVWPV